ncbi:uncharacterized protein LOC114398737 [Glycine soja]|uniref:uncharacterized protein LOC114398737 n=1 Tax=Glycine soja TaxID=3848 RepID=UPI00103D8A93|nr:uncharacterized protein LOC114398737 [Glycine soja]
MHSIIRVFRLAPGALSTQCLPNQGRAHPHKGGGGSLGFGSNPALPSQQCLLWLGPQHGKKLLSKASSDFCPDPNDVWGSLTSLIANQLAVVIPGKIPLPPFPKWYNPSATYAYHGGAPGHSVEQCLALKNKVQSLIEAGWLTFQEDGANIKTNPLANHRGGAVNAIEVSRSHGPKLLKNVTTSRRFIYKALQKAGVIPHGEHNEDSCLMHPGMLHDMETCSAVGDLLQQMIDQGRLEVSNEGEDEKHVYMQSVDKEGPIKPKPLVILFTRDTTPQRPQHPSAVSGARPLSFPYENSRAVPWRYTPPGRRKEEATDIGSLSAKVTNITGLSGMTRSGRVFTPPSLSLQFANFKGKAKITEGQNVKVIPAPDEDVPTKDFSEGREGCGKKEVSLEEAGEFLLLNEAHIAQDISVEGFGGIVNNITASNYLTFTEEEILVEGRGHNRALHVSVKCMEHVMAKVLIDNGSSLNVMPKSTLEKLPFNASYVRPSSMVVCAFDGTRREVSGEIDLPVQIGPHTCQVTFQVMDINPAYNFLLGRPWIHSVRVVPSMLHQKLKFVVGGHLVIVSGEEDVLVVSFASVDSLPRWPCLSNAAMMVARVMLGHGYEPGMGLGKNNGGRTNLVSTRGNRRKFGLGYKPTHADIRKNISERKNKGQGPRSGQRAKEAPLCNISSSFVSAGLRHEGQVATICNDDSPRRSDLVQPCPPGFQLGNWQVEECPDVYVTSIISDDESRECTNTRDLAVNFEQEASQKENEEDEDVGLPPELERIIAQEDREMRSHQEETELVGLGTDNGRREVKVGTDYL